MWETTPLLWVVEHHAKPIVIDAFNTLTDIDGFEFGMIDRKVRLLLCD